MLVKVKQKVEVEEEIDVDFPVYRKYVNEKYEYATFSMVDENFKEIWLCVNSEDKSCTIEVYYNTVDSYSKESLVQTSNKEEFECAIALAKKELEYDTTRENSAG